jgi:hypothetical protein
MKKSEFKEMIKESVKEVLIEEGVLKSVISEVVKAVGQTQTVQQPVATQQTFTEQASLEAVEKQKQKLAETRKKMLDAIGKDSCGGVDLFEGTTPIKKAGSPAAPTGSPSSALEGVDPNDSGVDISSLLGGANVWKQLIK